MDIEEVALTFGYQMFPECTIDFVIDEKHVTSELIESWFKTLALFEIEDVTLISENEKVQEKIDDLEVEGVDYLKVNDDILNVISNAIENELKSIIYSGDGDVDDCEVSCEKSDGKYYFRAVLVNEYDDNIEEINKFLDDIFKKNNFIIGTVGDYEAVFYYNDSDLDTWIQRGYKKSELSFNGILKKEVDLEQFSQHNHEVDDITFLVGSKNWLGKDVFRYLDESKIENLRSDMKVEVVENGYIITLFDDYDTLNDIESDRVIWKYRETLGFDTFLHDLEHKQNRKILFDLFVN